MAKDLTTTNGFLQTEDSEYVRLVSPISGVWDKAREKAALAVNTELLDASWETGRYIVEYEQHGNVKAEYGKQLLTNLSKDLTRLRGRGYSTKIWGLSVIHKPDSYPLIAFSQFLSAHRHLQASGAIRHVMTNDYRIFSSFR